MERFDPYANLTESQYPLVLGGEQHPSRIA